MTAGRGESGLQVPTGDYGDAAKSGFGGAVSVDYAVSPAVTLGGTILYSRNGISVSDSRSDAGLNGGFGVMFDAGSKTHMGLQGLYHDIFTQVKSRQYFNLQAVFSFDLNTP